MLKLSVTTVFGASVLAFGFAAPAGAQIYKWTDAAGGVHYSNLTPPKGTAVQRVPTDQLSVVPLPKPSAEEVQALNERLQDRRVQRLEDELRARRMAPEIDQTDLASYPVYPITGGFYDDFGAFPPLGEIIIDRDGGRGVDGWRGRRAGDRGDRRHWRGRGHSHTSIQFIPRYEVRPGPFGIGAQTVPVRPTPRLHLRAPQRHR